MPSAFVVGVQQELRELVDGAAGTGHVAGDGRGDPVPVLGRALAVRAQDHAPAVGAEPAVTAHCIAAREVAEQDQIGRSRRELGEALGAAAAGELSLGEWLVGAVCHGGVVSQGRGRRPGPLKPRVASGTDLPSVPGETSRFAVLEASCAWLRTGVSPSLES